MNLPGPDLAAYRAAVDDLMLDLAAHTGVNGLHKTEMILGERLPGREFAEVFAATPGGADTVMRTLGFEVETYHPNHRTSADDRAALIRIFLLSLIDSVWWGHTSPYESDDDVEHAPDLVELDASLVRFRYRSQPTSFARRLMRAAERRTVPGRTPHTAGLRFTRVRPEAIALLDQLAEAFAEATPAGTPPLWVTSLTRSVSHQHRLRSLGYAATLPSSHCTGWGIDVEMTWYQRFDVHDTLARLLIERQEAGDINVIGEGQAWHVCISPSAADRLLHAYHDRIGG